MKKTLALILTMCLVLSVFATFAVTASAATPTWKDGWVNDPADTNPDDGQNLKFDNAYDYTFVIEGNKKIGGEDNELIETVDEYNACNPNWAISVLLKPTAEAGVYEVAMPAVVTPGSAAAGLEKGINFDNGNIVLVAHSAYSYAHEKGLNYTGKLAALALKVGDKVKVADDKSSVYVLIPESGETVVIENQKVSGITYTTSQLFRQNEQWTWGDDSPIAYPDSGNELFDGVFAPAEKHELYDANAGAWMGFHALCPDYKEVGYAWIKLDLGKSYDLTDVVLYTASSAVSSAKAANVKVLVSEDGETWADFGAVDSVDDASVTVIKNTVTGSATGRYVEIRVTAAGHWLGVCEAEVFADVVVSGGSTTIKEEITVDGDLNDNGWAKDKWIVVDHETGYLQNTYEIQQGTAVAADFGYKYQLRTDDTKLYGAIVVDGAPVAGGNGKGTFPRLWIRDNDEATVYTSFYNIEFDADGNVITGARYNTSTTENSSAKIENSTFVAFAKEVDGKSVFEFSVDIAEFCADGTFDYFLSVSQLAGENYGCLYHPASEIGPTNPAGGENHIPHKWLPFHTWHTEKDATINVKDIALGEINLGNVIKEVVTVDGDVNDTGWAKKGWITVSGENGTWQHQSDYDFGKAVCPEFTYKYQMRADETKLYVAVEFDGEPLNDKATMLRLWFRDNDEATVYTSFYDVFFVDGAVSTLAKYNTSTTANSGAEITDTTFNVAAKTEGGKTVIEYSIDLAEFTEDGTFDYYINLAHKVGENSGTLYHPAVPYGPTDINGGEGHKPHINFPWNTWAAENDATVNVEDIVLGEVVVSDKEEADTSMMGEAPADPAFTVTLNTAEGWVAGEKLVVTATVDVLKDGVDLSQILFNLYYDAADVEIVLPEELGAIITSGKDSWKEDSLFTLSVDGEYGVIECAPATTEEADVLKKGDKLVMTFEFTVKEDAEGLINFQLSNKGLVGYSWDLDAAEAAGAGSSLAVANADNYGDTGIYVIAALALVALIGTAIVIKKRA